MIGFLISLSFMGRKPPRFQRNFIIVEVQPCVIALLDSDLVRITHEPRMICGSLGFCVDPVYVSHDVALFACIIALLLGAILG